MKAVHARIRIIMLALNRVLGYHLKRNFLYLELAFVVMYGI